MRHKAKWRAALEGICLIMVVVGIVCIIIDMIWHRSWDLVDTWVMVPAIASLLLERAAKFPFGKDYILAVDIGNADWKIRFLWLVSVMLNVFMITAILLYGTLYLNGIGGLFWLLWMVLLHVPKDEKFQSRLCGSETQPASTGEAHA